MIKDEKIMIKKLKEGNMTAFNSVLELYETKVFRMIHGMVLNVSDAEELTQEVFIKVFNKITRFQGQSKLYTWICQIALNQARNFLNRQKLIQFLSFDWLSDSKHIEFADEARVGETQLKIEQNDRIEVLYQALDQLSQNHRRLIVLYEIEELDYESISEILKIPIGTVKSRLSRARANLKTVLEQEVKNERL